MVLLLNAKKGRSIEIKKGRVITVGLVNGGDFTSKNFSGKGIEKIEVYSNKSGFVSITFHSKDGGVKTETMAFQ